jgi:ATP-dependent helicase HepA
LASSLPIGFKVRVAGLEHYGFGEVASFPDESGSLDVDFYRGPVQFERVRVRATKLKRTPVPTQTRCFLAIPTGFRVGRVVGHVDAQVGKAVVYHVSLPNEPRARQLDETQFRVRSILGSADPAETLGALAHETPFFFENRSRWVAAYDRYAHASRAIHGLTSAGVELFPHQADAVRRVLQDPHLRYLLADEVGLGKTIEAGAILRQLEVDDPGIRTLVLVPLVLREQWEWELRRRFHVSRATVRAHTEVDCLVDEAFALIVVDEAHRLIALDGWDNGASTFNSLRKLCAAASHLLLLSATPILHRDMEMLALLHLLDPEQYQLGDLESFRRRIARRAPIGRLLLALERASSPFVVRRQLELLGKELADDEEVQAALSTAPPSGGSEHEDAWRALATRIRVLVAETWRLHRRLVRTRRSALIEEGEIQRLRRVEEPETTSSYHEGNPDAVQNLWAAVDEFRATAAAEALRLPEPVAAKLRDGYLEIAQAAALAGTPLDKVVHAMQLDPDWSFAAEPLAQIERAAKSVVVFARLEALEDILRYEPGPRWVIFCRDTGMVRDVSSRLARSFPEALVLSLAAPDVASAGPTVQEFAASTRQAFLVVDMAAEEGLNLQAADRLVLMDLPFQPLRLEQRIGRLDRLDRTRPLRAIAILSVDDSNDDRLAFDRAWYEVLVHGLGLFEDSIADVPFLLERQLDEMGRLAFERGPAALYDHAKVLKEKLEAERKEAEEQAVIDGTSIAGVRTSPWWKALDEVDAEEEELAQAFEGYVSRTLGLSLASDDGQRVALGARRFLLTRNPSREILLPAERLLPLADARNVRFTFNRKRATQESDIQLLRPGCQLLDWLRALADWDDRGRAFAMWRPVLEWKEPRIVIRVCVTATLDELPDHVLDTVGQAALKRLAGNWIGPWRGEWFFHPDGTLADEDLAAQCRPPYDRRTDQNLGGDRARLLPEVVGTADWPALCQRWAAAALETRPRPRAGSRAAAGGPGASMSARRAPRRGRLRPSAPRARTARPRGEGRRRLAGGRPLVSERRQDGAAAVGAGVRVQAPPARSPARGRL